jgi:TIR domain
MIGSSPNSALGAPVADPARQALHRVFVSYSRTDFYFAEQLAVALRRRGLIVWFDVHELVPGTDWSAAIDRAIVECDTFVLVASRAALASPYVQRERYRAVELGRSCVAVLPRRRRRSDSLAIPTYDLTTAFGGGIDQLAGDIVSGRPRGRQRRLPLPYPGAASLVVLAPALCTIFAVVLGVSFARVIAGTEVILDPTVRQAVPVAGALIGGLAAWSAYVCWAFSRRRVSWLNLRGWQVQIAFIALFIWWFAELVAGSAADPLAVALGQSSDVIYLGYAPGYLALGVVVMAVVAAISTSFAAGVTRHLKTGIAPRRVRRRHVGAVPQPLDARVPARTCRLFAAAGDSRIAEDVRRALFDAGMSDVGDGSDSDRQIVVVSDRTPTDWLSWEFLRDPVAVVATSVALPVRGSMGRFQWVDHRRRRRRTLVDLGRSLTAKDTAAEKRTAPELPERLQQVRLPFWLMVTEWTLLAMAALATVVAAYPYEQRLFTGRSAEWWPTVLCLPITVALILLAWLVRRRRITLGVLLAAVTGCWLGMIAGGLDSVVSAMFPSSNPNAFFSASVAYPLVSAVIFGLAWRSLRAWLPSRAAVGTPRQTTLGAARGSWPLWVAVTPLFLGLVSASGFTSPEPTLDTLPTTVDDGVCLDQAGLEALAAPLGAVNNQLGVTIMDTRSYVEARVQAADTVLADLERYEPIGSWGADMKARLTVALDRSVRADHAFLDLRIDVAAWEAEHDELRRTVDDFTAPLCG